MASIRNPHLSLCHEWRRMAIVRMNGPGRQTTVNYYFDEGHTLSKNRTSDGSDQYQVDFTTDSRQQGQNRWGLALNYITI